MKRQKPKQKYFDNYTAIKHFMFVMPVIAFILIIIILLSVIFVVIATQIFNVNQMLFWLVIAVLLASQSIFSTSLKASIIMVIIGHIYHKKHQNPISAKTLFWIGIPIYCLTTLITSHGIIDKTSITDIDHMIKTSLVILFIAVIFSTINAYYIKKLNHSISKT